jgi:CRISPR-associated protein Cmr2
MRAEDRITKKHYKKGLLVLSGVTKSAQLQGPSGCRTSADVRVIGSGYNRRQDARDENKSNESGGKSGERRREDGLCEPPGPVAREFERNPTTTMTNWKNKLRAFLHDPPSKAFDIPNHESWALTLLRQAGFSQEEAERFSRQADWDASAADRLPFPASQAGGLRCHFDGVRNRFHHPFGSGATDDALTLPFQGEFVTSDLVHETDQAIQPVLAGFGDIPDDSSDPCGKRWRARFFTHWRLWQKHAAERDYRFAFLPADTRIPDHTIWTHMQVVSALAGCAASADPASAPKAAFLKFQLGPVQDFIAAARSIRDLWSGSYLLSWLMAAGMRALSSEVGPAAVIFPNLRGQPLFDLHWRDELWSKVNIGSQTVWESLDWPNRELLTPNLPNVFLAVVPAERAAELGQAVEGAIQNEWKRIAEAVWTECQEAGLTKDEGGFTAAAREDRFNAQIARFLSLSWQITPWPNSLEDALKLANSFDTAMPIQKAHERVQAVVEMATRQMPMEHRDGRYYVGGKGGPKDTLNNIGLGWSVILAFNRWALDAVRQTRHFNAANTGGWQTGTFNNKDALTGRDEAVAGGGEWSRRAAAAGEFWPSLFKKDDWLSASTLVKRVWHRAYLEKDWGLKTDSRGFPMPNTRGIAGHQPEEDCRDDETAEDAAPSEKYFAVLAFDGDEIGKWVSGEKTPPFSSQLADYHDGSNAQRFGSKPYFEKPGLSEFLKARRPLSPSYHLQFSEALSNFALLCARPIVEAFDGRLIYAGGDDVVALLPSDTVLACAEALRLAFTGSPGLKAFLEQHARRLRERHESEQQRHFEAPPAPCYQKLASEGCLIDCPAPGFVCRLDHVDQQDVPIPFLVPGPAADASVGIAIAHFKSPLQDVVRAAQTAEKRAKKQLDRSAVAVTLFKRSGETIEWGCKWAGGGLDVYRALADALLADQLSNKFPYRVVELLEPYLTQQTGLAKTTLAPGFKAVVDEIIRRDFAVVCGRQCRPGWTTDLTKQLLCLLAQYLDGLGEAEKKVRDVIGLCQTVAFASRTRDESANPQSIIGNSQSV